MPRPDHSHDHYSNQGTGAHNKGDTHKPGNHQVNDNNHKPNENQTGK